MKDNINKVFYRSSTKMQEVENNSVYLIITSSPYFNIKDYSKNGYQNIAHSTRLKSDIGGG